MDDLLDSRIRLPGIEGITSWINTKPLEIEDLRGKVVLIEFWTYTCVNCIRTMAYLKKWHEKYSHKGLVVIGIHTPEFEFEKDLENVKNAVKEFGIKYPVALDNDKVMWQMFDNHHWPAKFLIDKEGAIISAHLGEGAYSDIESDIQQLLGLKDKIEKEDMPGYMFDQSPETYSGFARSGGLGSGLACDEKSCNIYLDQAKQGEHELDVLYPHGQWIQEKEYLELVKAPGLLSYRFNAREVNLVMEPVDKYAEVEVYVDGKKTDTVKVNLPQMYKLFKDKNYSERELTLTFNGKIRVYVFTFG